MNLKVGDRFSISKQITDEVVREFAEFSGDFNPIHLDDGFARKTQFGQRIAHGMIQGALISAVLGFHLSERRVAFLGQTMRFENPVFIGETVTVTAIVTHIRADKPIVTLETVCAKQNGEIAVTGEAVLKVLSD